MDHFSSFSIEGTRSQQRVVLETFGVRKMRIQTAIELLALALASNGCWATGNASMIYENPGKGGLLKYEPGRDSWFARWGADDGEKTALRKAFQLAWMSCGPAGVRTLEEGMVETGYRVERNEGFEWQKEKRMRYICGNAPADYVLPPIDLFVTPEAAENAQTHINASAN